MGGQIVDMEELVASAEKLLENEGRRFVAVAGAPGSGKSTTAEMLVDILNRRHPGQVAILPMDGFHYDDAVLEQMGRRPWKGAPDTFDVGGLRSTLLRLRASEEKLVAVPVFDRSLEVSRGSARLIPSETKLIIVEGNYVLLDEAPWSDLADCFDLTVMIDVPETELRERLRQRWVGFGLNEEEIAHKLDGNDLPNGRRVRENSRAADLIFRQE